MDDVFDQIVRGEIPTEIVYEDEDTMAFLDANPNSRGHTLVIPKKHVKNLFDVDDDTLAAVMRTVRKLAPAVRDAVGAHGMKVVSNNEAASGQAVFHLHFHLIPCFKDEGHWYDSWPHVTYADGERAEVAEKIRSSARA